ncbi:hypothetical protein AB1Y20_005488 [Prymnesium parvum]|uniref:C3H1-type domain-containing protein n=1 Tax=Prymnesium parvum TaxID=97485 RepID=A0AB34J6P6_PRYPA
MRRRYPAAAYYDDGEDGAARQARTAKAQRQMRRRENLQRQREEAAERRALRAAEQEAEAAAGADAEIVAAEPPGLQTAQLITQRDVAAVHFPLDYAAPIPHADSQPRLRVLLHTDHPVGEGQPTLHNVEWTVSTLVSGYGEAHPLVSRLPLRRLSASSDTCWVAELPLPAAFAQPHLLASTPTGAAAADDLEETREALAIEDDDEAVAAVERLIGDDHAADVVECLLSHAVTLRSGSNDGVVMLRVGNRTVQIAASDPERAVRTVHVQGFVGGSLPPYADVRLVDRQSNPVVVQNVPLVFLSLRGTLRFDVSLPGTPGHRAEVQSVRIADVTPADLLSGTLFVELPLAPPSQYFPALVSRHWCRVYLELLAALPALDAPTSERLRIHAHLLAFAARQTLRISLAARTGRHGGVALGSLLESADLPTAGRRGCVAHNGAQALLAQDFVTDALLAGVPRRLEAEGRGGSSSADAAKGGGEGEAALWVLGLAGQLERACHHPVRPDGSAAGDEVAHLRKVQVRPPAAVWAWLRRELWSGDGRRALAAGFDELRGHYGGRAVRSGVTAMLAPDAQWLLAHPVAHVFSLGVSSYRFSRLLPIRAALGEGGGGARQYAIQLAADAVLGWQHKLGAVRRVGLNDGAVLRSWRAGETVGRGGVGALRRRLGQADALVSLARELAVLFRRAAADPTACGEVQALLIDAAKTIQAAACDVLESARCVPALAPEGEEAREGLRTLFLPLREERPELFSSYEEEDGVEGARRALASDGALLWGGLRRAYLLLDHVLRTVDSSTMRDEDLALRANRLDRGLVAARSEPDVGEYTDELQACGEAIARAADGTLPTLKALNIEARSLEHELGRFSLPAAELHDDAFVCYPMALAKAEREAAAPARGRGFSQPVQSVSLSERRLLILDAGDSTLRVVDTAKGEVSTITGSRGVGHADGVLNMSKFSQPQGMCLYSEGVLVVADTMNSVLRCVELGKELGKELGRVSTFAGVAQSKGAVDGWANTFHSPTSLVRLPGGELLVADTGNHTLRLVEVGGKAGPLICKSMEGAWESDNVLRRTAELRKQTMLAKVTTVAGKSGEQGFTDGKSGEALLASPTCLILTGKCTVQSSAVLFLQEGGDGWPPLLRLVSIGRSKPTGKPNDAPKLTFRVSTLHRFGETPRRGPSSILDLSGHAKEIVVADGGALLLLKLQSSGSDEARAESYVQSEICDAEGQPIALDGELHLGVTQAGVIVVAHAGRGVLYRLLPPAVWKRADRKVEKLLEQVEEVVAPLHSECASGLAKIDALQHEVAEAEQLVQKASLAAKRTAFAAECDFLLTGAVAGAPPMIPEGATLALCALLLNAPSLSDYMQLLRHTPLPTGQLEEVRNCLSTFLRGVRWPADTNAARDDVEVLLLLDKAQPSLVDSDVVAAVLRNDTFVAAPDGPTLRLLLQCRRRKEDATEASVPSDVGESGEEVASAGLAPVNEHDDAPSLFPVHGPAALGLVAWVSRLTPAEWELPSRAGREEKPVNAARLIRWAAGLIPIARMVGDELAAATWVLDMICRTLEDAGRGLETVGALSELLAERDGAASCLEGVLLGLVLASCRRSAASSPMSAFSLLTVQLEGHLRSSMEQSDPAEASLGEAADVSAAAPGAAGPYQSPPRADARFLPIAGELLAFTLATICPANAVTMEVMIEAPETWTAFLCFQRELVALQPVVSQPKECEEFVHTSRELADTARAVRRALAAAADLSTCPMGRLRVYRSRLRLLEPLFTVAGSSLHKAELVQALEDVDSARMRLRDVLRVALELLHDSEILRCCTVLEGGWDSNSLEDASAFLRLELRKGKADGTLGPLRLKSKGGRQHRLPPLPTMLVAALDWLLVVCESRVFRRFWANAVADVRVDQDALHEQMVSQQADLPKTDVDADAGPMLMPFKEASSISHEAAALDEEEWLCRALSAARASWTNTFHGLLTMTSRLEELRELVTLLLHEHEVHTLEISAAGLLDVNMKSDELHAADAWLLVSANDEWQREARDKLVKLAHVCAVREVLPRIRSCLDLFDVWVEPSADETLSLSTVKETAAQLASVLEECWSDATLEDLQKISSLAEVVDARLLLFEDELFRETQTSDCSKLIQWYRLTPDEQNFTTSVEMAMGRSQMECPDALWNHEQRCVDERKLSMLSSARAYLHEHIFGSGDGDPRLPAIRAGNENEALPTCERYTYSSLLDVFSRLDWTKAAGIAHALRACAPLVGSFIGLMGNDADAAAPHRLAALQGQQMRARFWCSSRPPEFNSARTEVTTTATAEDGLILTPSRSSSQAMMHSTSPSAMDAASLQASTDELGDGQSQEGFVFLQYYVKKESKLVAHMLPLSEILDFQTTVVLATTNEQQDDMTTAINKFVHQVSLMQMLSTTLWELRCAGHFGFLSYAMTFELADDVVSIQSALEASKASLSWWRALTAELRHEHSCLNICTLLQLSPLLNALHESLGEEGKGRVKDELHDIVQLISPGFNDATSGGAVSDAAAVLLQAWVSASKAEPCASSTAQDAKDAFAERQLRRLAAALDEALLLIPTRIRRVNRSSLNDPVPEQDRLNALPEDGAHGELPSGVHLVCAETDASAYQLLFAAFVHHGALPEGHSAFLCWEGSTREELDCFIRRWRATKRSQLGSPLFTLCGVDSLGIESQHELVSLIQLAMANTADEAPPLLLICNSTDTSPVLLSLGYLRKPLRGPLSPLPRREIRQLLAPMGFAILSAITGGGKSFAVRAAAAADGRRYLHVPVHSASHRALLKRVRRGLMAISCQEPVLVHLDLSTGVNHDIDVWLFSMIVLGSVVDPDNGRAIVLEAPRIRFAIELPTSRGNAALEVPPMLPVKWVYPSASTFCANSESLLEGLGDVVVAESRAAQLRRVCIALSDLRSSDATHDNNFLFGSRAAVVTAAAAHGGDLSAPECFQSLLMVLDDSNGEGPPPSLTCMWNFVSAFDFQLQQLNMPLSAVSAALQPDPGTDVPVYEGDLKRKQINALQVILIKSARELAGRPAAKTADGYLALPHDALCAQNPRVRGGLVEVVGRNFSTTKSGLQGLNGRWTRCAFTNDGEECYTRMCQVSSSADDVVKGKLFLYFRALEGRWVVSNSITPKGPAFAASLSHRMAGPWTKPSSWRQDVRISATEVTCENGYMSAGVLIEGCRTMDGYEPTAQENGTYVLQVPSYRYDEEKKLYFLGSHKFQSKPVQPDEIPIQYRHYVLSSQILDSETNMPLRRHLKFNIELKRWEISPLCHSLEDVKCVSMSAAFDSGWCQRLVASSDPGEFQNGRLGGRRMRNPLEFERQPETDEDEVEDQEVDDDNIDYEEEEEEDESQFVAPLPWNDSPHQFALLGSDRMKMLGLDTEQMNAEMHPELRLFLQKNHIEIGESLEKVNANHAEVLSLITGVHRSRKSASSILGGEFHLTGDAIFKMQAIYARLACGIPVVLSGECGCGKTFALKYIAEWLRAELLVLNVHGGTTVSEIFAVLEDAESRLLADDRSAQEHGDVDTSTPSSTADERQEEYLSNSGHEDMPEAATEGKEEPHIPESSVQRGSRSVFVFFDELNACAHVAVMVEAITKHSIAGRALHPRLRVFAAVNPYRIRAPRQDESGSETPGLVFNLGGEVQDDMSKLVYRVHAIPRSLQQFVFDFGYLEPVQEAQYIRAILVRHLGSLLAKGLDVQKIDAICALSLLLASQEVVRKYENDPSVVSLRDAVRACELMDWFALRIMKRDDSKKASAKGRAVAVKISPVAAALVLALSFVYMYRLPHARTRKTYWKALCDALDGTRNGRGRCGALSVLASEDYGYGTDSSRTNKQTAVLARDFDESGFCGLIQEGRCAAVLAQVQKRFVRNMEVEEGVAMNDALSENLFVTCICVLNLLPLFIVGKPGTSKTLTMQVLSNNLQGNRSPNPFFRDFPAIHIFPYQCSPMSASNAIQHQFDIACRFQQHATSIVSVLLLDEVGLAEHSPDMPLKVLHAMLVKPPIAIVGLSNWTLDSAKMNRAICIQRTEPSPLDIELTAQSIVGAPSTPPPSKEVLQPQRERTNDRQATWLKPVCLAYHAVYTSQNGRDFLGMRDLYACIKKLSATARKAALKDEAEMDAVENAITRNFGGKISELHRVLISFHSHRLSVTDPYGLNQGMAEVSVVLQHQPDGSFDDHLNLGCAELHEHSVVRRGVVILSVDHGHTCVLHGEEPRTDGQALRPCDVILPGDVLVAVECNSLAEAKEDGASSHTDQEPSDSPACLWMETVDTTIEARTALKKLKKHTYTLKLLRKADRAGETERVRAALADLPFEVDPTAELLMGVGLSQDEADRACRQVALLQERFFGESQRFTWPNDRIWRSSGRHTGWELEYAYAERKRQERFLESSPGQTAAEKKKAKEAARRAEEEALRAKETKAQTAARKRQEALYAKQAEIAGISQNVEASSSSTPPPSVTSEATTETSAPEVTSEDDPFAPDVRVTLNGQLVTERELLTCVEKGEVLDPLSGRKVQPQYFGDGGKDNVEYELARRRVGLPARSGFEDAMLYYDPVTRKPLQPGNFTRTAMEVVRTGILGEEETRPVLDHDGHIVYEHDAYAYEQARRRVGLPWRKDILMEERHLNIVHVGFLRKNIPELALSRIVPGTGGLRMTRLQQYTLYGPAGQPAPCCWSALFGQCARGKSCRLCDHGAVVPAEWISSARSVGCVRPPIWHFMEPGFQFSTPTQELVLGNLQDRSSRHLMLLTHNAAALQLLFYGGMLKEDGVDVLFGSRFPDDVSELQLVQQVNRVKIAMAEGRTIVLVNHDNIYEALYDVLNQRYLVKRDPTTGATRRLLRLAIGSRSQLCVCHDAFKVVVIVEERHAHERLDLPLLNRFEKQLFTPEQAISTGQRRLRDELAKWTDCILAGLGMSLPLEGQPLSPSPTELQQKQRALEKVFCGWHDGIIASLALQLPADANLEEDALTRGKVALLRIAKPLAVFHSKLLRSVPGFHLYFEQHRDLIAAAKTFFVPSISDKRLYLIVTQSPIHHCGQALQSSSPNGENIRFSLTQLARFGSEDALGLAVENFLLTETEEDQTASSSAVLLIQYDPADSAPGLLEHAMYIVQQRHTLARRTASASMSNKYVVLVVHLPPGTSRAKRHVALDFSPRWSFVFVDDLRVEDVRQEQRVIQGGDAAEALLDEGKLLISSLSLPQLLGFSLHELLANDRQHGLSLSTILRSEARNALGRLLQPVQDLTGADTISRLSFSARVQSVGVLLSKVPKFEEMVGAGVLTVLARGTAADAHGFHLQASYARTFGGTCREAVREASSKIIVQALAHVLSALDENFNLDLLGRFADAGASSSSDIDQGDSGMALWHALGNCSAILDWTVVASAAKLGRSEDSGAHAVGGSSALKQVPNSGKHGPLVARFPFSGRLIRLLESKHIREALSASTDSDLQTTGQDSRQHLRMSALISSVLGSHVGELIDAFTHTQPMAYLHDMVASTAPRFPGLTFESHLQLHALVLRAHAPGSHPSPGTVHALVWANERRLHHAARLLGSIEQEGKSSLARDALNRIDAALGISISRGDDALHAILDLGVVGVVVDSIWHQTSEAMIGESSSEAVKELWRSSLNTARLVAADVEALLLIALAACDHISDVRTGATSSKSVGLTTQSFESVMKDLGQMSVSWRALVIVHLFARDVLLGSAEGVGIKRDSIKLFAAACKGFCARRYEQTVMGATHIGIRALLQSAAAAAAPLDPSCERLGRFVFALSRDVILRLSVSGETSKLEGAATLFDDLVDIVSGKASWLPTLPQPARELLLDALHDASSGLPALAKALDQICTRGPEGCVLALRHEERQLHLLVAEASDQADFAAAIGATEKDLQAAVRLGSASDADNVETLSNYLHSKNGLTQLKAASKAKMILTHYSSWLSDMLRRGQTTLPELLPNAEPVRALAEKHLLASKPLSLILFVLQHLYHKGGPVLIRKLLALPTDVSSWVPVIKEVRRSFQSKKKRSVANPFSLLVEPSKGASKEYTRMHHIAQEIMNLRTTDSKQTDKLIETLENLASRETVRSNDDSLVTALIAANFYLKSSKPKLSFSQELARTKQEDFRLQSTYGKANAASAAKTEEYLRSSCEHAMTQLINRKFAAPKFRDLLLYILDGCAGNALLPSFDRAQEVSESELARLFNTSEEASREDSTSKASQPVMPLQAQLDLLMETSTDIIPRAGPASTRVMRIFMHLLLHLHGSANSSWETLMVVLKPPSRAVQVEGEGAKVSFAERSVRAHLEDHVLRDWEALQSMFGLDEEQVMIALVLVAKRIHLASSSLKGFDHESARSSFEAVFEEKCVRPVLNLDVAATVINVQMQIDPTGDLDACRNALSVLWGYVAPNAEVRNHDHETKSRDKESRDFAGADNSSAAKAAAKAAATAHRLAWLWKSSPDSSLRLFKIDFSSSNTATKRFPLIAALLKHERRLPLIGCITDVLQWHAVLFRALRGGIRREEAAELTNAQAIERLPHDQQAEAFEILRNFCSSFNRSFVLVERLFECQENPYLYEDGNGEVQIDLSGSGGQTEEPMLMNPHVSVLYSLPSMVAGAQDADGLCTVQLCNVLSGAHNEIMGVLQESSTALLPRSANAFGTALPTISYQTSPEVMKQQLLYYSPERDLLPLLAAYRVESGGKSDGESGTGEPTERREHLPSFDFPAIERTLAHSVLSRATQLIVHVHHFEYQGELLRTGKMSALKERVPQRPLPPAILQAICDEVDTSQRQQSLLALLEQTVAFLGAMGADEAAEQPLRDYACSVLLLSPELWQSASTPGIEQHVRLCHLQSLFIALEEGTSDAFENVHPKYKEQIPGMLEERLKKDVRLRRSMLLPVLHEFITSQLVEGSWPTDANLKQYLTFTDPDLEDEAWYTDAFPDELTLCHAVALHQILSPQPQAQNESV